MGAGVIPHLQLRDSIRFPPCLVLFCTDKKTSCPFSGSQITWFLQAEKGEFVFFKTDQQNLHLFVVASYGLHLSLQVAVPRPVQTVVVFAAHPSAITALTLHHTNRTPSQSSTGLAQTAWNCLTLHICAYAHMYACLRWLSTVVRGALLLGADGLIWVCAPEAVLQTGDLMAGAYKKE